MALYDTKLPEYELGFRHGREYERKHVSCAEAGPNSVLYKIRQQATGFQVQTGVQPTRVYLGTAEIHTLAGDPALGLAHVMGLEVFAVKEQYHVKVA